MRERPEPLLKGFRRLEGLQPVQAGEEPPDDDDDNDDDRSAVPGADDHDDNDDLLFRLWHAALRTGDPR